MPDILRPDLKAATWLAIGFLAVPYLLKMFR